MGTRDGSIIATIITVHMPRNEAAAPAHVCPHIRIHAIDIVQPPGIGFSPIADIDAHQTMVAPALTANSSAEQARKMRSEARPETMGREISRPSVAPTARATWTSALVVLVMAAPPEARLVAPPGGAVAPLVHAPEAVEAARIGGIGVVDDAVLERERAHARPLASVGGHIGSGRGRDVRDGSVHPRPGFVPDQGHSRLAPIVVFDAAVAPLLLFGEVDVEVGVEVTAERGRPRKCPPHSLLVRLQLRERRARYRPEHHVMVRQMNREAIEAVCDCRAG